MPASQADPSMVRFPGLAELVQQGTHSTSAGLMPEDLQAVVVEAGRPISNREPKEFVIRFPADRAGEWESNTNCQGYSMLGCI